LVALKATKDPERRRQLLRKMSRLFAEIERNPIAPKSHLSHGSRLLVISFWNDEYSKALAEDLGRLASWTKRKSAANFLPSCSGFRTKQSIARGLRVAIFGRRFSELRRGHRPFILNVRNQEIAG
jgi:hypothetical protein